jgi:hypothetical protein
LPRPAVLLIDTPAASAANRAFLAAFAPDEVVPVGPAADPAEIGGRLGVTLAPPVAWTVTPPAGLWQRLPHADAVVLCPPAPRGLLLQAACLAGAARAPLCVVRDDPAQQLAVRHWLAHERPNTVYAAGAARLCCPTPPGVQRIELPTEDDVAATYLRCLPPDEPVAAVVVANPADGQEGLGGLSVLAPLVAVRHRAALVLTDPAGDDVEEAVGAALVRRRIADADTLILVASLRAVPMLRRPNPIPADKDPSIEMEPFTPAGAEPYTFATGRLFHDDPATLALVLARPRLLDNATGPRRALVASNAGNSLPLLESFSRNTANELRNAGYETTALFGKSVTRDEVRRLLPEHDVFLWEGHHSTLVKDWGFPSWDEPLPPSFVFLQSCLALQDWKALPLLNRGAVAVVGSSTRIYSGSGGASSLAFFDAVLYDDQPLGGALRQSKNFLVAYTRLKEKRLGKDTKATAANLRSAWAFTLWGDPTLRLPKPAAPASALPAVHHELRGNTLVVSLPSATYGKVVTARYQVEMPPNGRLAGLVQPHQADEEGQPLVPFVFAEVRLPRPASGQTPRLTGKLPDSHYVFCWDDRRSTGYLLALPRAKDRELRFQVEWETADHAENALLTGTGKR